MKQLLFSVTLFSLLFSSCTSHKKEEKVETKKTTINKEQIQQDSLAIRKIFDTALTDADCYEWLRELTSIGGRLSGSEEAAKAVKWSENLMKELELDSVWLQPVMVPHWVRGAKEKAYYTINGEKINVPITALGGSVATPKNGVLAEVIEVKSLEEAEKLGEQLAGKIVFYNRPMDPTLIKTGHAYGGCVNQRYSGARIAGKFGAVGVIVRSMSLKNDDYPHTGSMSYGDLPEDKRIPTAAISTKAADLLSENIQKKSSLTFFFEQHCENLPEVLSYNVIGELKGSEFPDEIMTIGGHLDSWDLGDGAHDDGTGVVQSLEVLQLFQKNNIKPRHTLRCVFFMNEENGLRGAKKYAEEAKAKNEKHVFALESDAGGHTPRGFSFDGNLASYEMMKEWRNLLEPYGIHEFTKEGSGADISPLKSETIVLSGYRPDSQRYFDYHHAETDTFDKVNKRELELGAAAMTSLVYLVDKYLPKQENVKP
ncbi:M20/M25/M40 family metallo-hydrolase [Aureivirga marina]|uniref:M20/M25/M40 family metallo-hydrolase n=1 Tax=Aureivirga marina TaxID=1182451 RepID=UPI0018C90CFF|nr:M20/M25/M40 family metallo-hydrolase [Aureivirga marina]